MTGIAAVAPRSKPFITQRFWQASINIAASIRWHRNAFAPRWNDLVHKKQGTRQ
jgi:hypothetical protein